MPTARPFGAGPDQYTQQTTPSGSLQPDRVAVVGPKSLFSSILDAVQPTVATATTAVQAYTGAKVAEYQLGEAKAKDAYAASGDILPLTGFYTANRDSGPMPIRMAAAEGHAEAVTRYNYSVQQTQEELAKAQAKELEDTQAAARKTEADTVNAVLSAGELDYATTRDGQKLMDHLATASQMAKKLNRLDLQDTFNKHATKMIDLLRRNEESAASDAQLKFNTSVEAAKSVASQVDALAVASAKDPTSNLVQIVNSDMDATNKMAAFFKEYGRTVGAFMSVDRLGLDGLPMDPILSREMRNKGLVTFLNMVGQASKDRIEQNTKETIAGATSAIASSTSAADAIKIIEVFSTSSVYKEDPVRGNSTIVAGLKAAVENNLERLKTGTVGSVQLMKEIDKISKFSVQKGLDLNPSLGEVRNKVDEAMQMKFAVMTGQVISGIKSPLKADVLLAADAGDGNSTALHVALMAAEATGEWTKAEIDNASALGSLDALKTDPYKEVVARGLERAYNEFKPSAVSETRSKLEQKYIAVMNGAVPSAEDASQFESHAVKAMTTEGQDFLSTNYPALFPPGTFDKFGDNNPANDVQNLKVAGSIAQLDRVMYGNGAVIPDATKTKEILANLRSGRRSEAMIAMQEIRAFGGLGNPMWRDTVTRVKDNDSDDYAALLYSASLVDKLGNLDNTNGDWFSNLTSGLRFIDSTKYNPTEMEGVLKDTFELGSEFTLTSSESNALGEVAALFNLKAKDPKMAGKMMKEHLAAAGLKVITNRVSGRAEILPDPGNVYIPLEEQDSLLREILRSPVSDVHQASTQQFFGATTQQATVFDYVKDAIGRRGAGLRDFEFTLDFSLTALTNYAEAPEVTDQSPVGSGGNNAYLRFGSKGGYLFIRDRYSADQTWKPVYANGKPMRIGAHSVGTSTWNGVAREEERQWADFKPQGGYIDLGWGR